MCVFNLNKNIMKETIDFAVWLNIQRYKDTQFMNRKELEEMYLIYTNQLETGYYKNE